MQGLATRTLTHWEEGRCRDGVPRDEGRLVRRAGCLCPRWCRLTARQEHPTRRTAPTTALRPSPTLLGLLRGRRCARPQPCTLGKPWAPPQRLVFVCHLLLVEAEHEERLVEQLEPSRTSRAASHAQTSAQRATCGGQLRCGCAARRRREQGAAHLRAQGRSTMWSFLRECISTGEPINYLVAHIGF